MFPCSLPKGGVFSNAFSERKANLHLRIIGDVGQDKSRCGRGKYIGIEQAGRSTSRLGDGSLCSEFVRYDEEIPSSRKRCGGRGINTGKVVGIGGAKI